MDKDEREMLIRVDEWAHEMRSKHRHCDIPIRVSALEKHQIRIEAGIAIIVFLISATHVINLIAKLLNYKI